MRYVMVRFAPRDDFSEVGVRVRKIIKRGSGENIRETKRSKAQAKRPDSYRDSMTRPACPQQVGRFGLNPEAVVCGTLTVVLLHYWLRHERNYFARVSD